MKIAIIGGGAAGFFSALAAKEFNPNASVLLFEQSGKLLSKVKVSGGGRCNVTHFCFDPKKLVENYPRGHRELLGPFHTFQPRDTIEWFKKRGVSLKKEDDGRMFPISDSSETIINCFYEEAKRLGVQIATLSKLIRIDQTKGGFTLSFKNKQPVFVDRLIMATGSAKAGFEIGARFSHTIQPPVPSLFTFNVPAFPLSDLSGVSVNLAKLKVEGSEHAQVGPLLITHFGFSGPCALKLSAWAARELSEKKYEFTLLVDWIPNISEEKFRDKVQDLREHHPSKKLGSLKFDDLPRSLWKTLVDRSSLSPDTNLRSLGKSAITSLLKGLKYDRFDVKGKTTNKEEFVTCGGITLSEVNFKTMESKRVKHLFFCGEILDIDGVTGGFNFQSAWTTGWLAGKAAAREF